MIASLPMYARPYNRAAHDAFWALIRDGLRAHGIMAPDTLDHEIGESDGWAAPDLVLGQICNLPYRARFRGKVTLIGAADYGLPGCDPGYYNSVFIAHGDSAGNSPQDFAKGRFACNALMSHSGYGAPQQWAAAQGFTFTAPLITGSHAASITAVAEGRADIAAIDAHTWWTEQQAGNDAPVRVIGHTHATPGLTYITRAGQDPAPYFDAIAQAIKGLVAPDRAVLGLQGIVALPADAYNIPMPPLPHSIGA